MLLSTMIYLSILFFFFDSAEICAWTIRPESSTDLHRIVILPEIKQLSTEHHGQPRRHVLRQLAALTGSIFVSPVAGYAVEGATKDPVEESSDSSDADSAKISGTDRVGDVTSNEGVAADDDETSSMDGETSDDTSDDEMSP